MGRQEKPRSKVEPKRASSGPRGGARGGERTPARSAADKRREQRQQRLRKQRLRTRLRLGAIVLLALGLVWGVIAIYQSSLFAVQSVEVVGNDRIDVDRVLEIAQVPQDATLLRFSGAAVKERLEADPWVSEALVTRDFPDAMRIRIAEREPVAYVDTGTEAYWLVDPEGFVVARETPDTTATLVVLRDLEGFEPEVGVESPHVPLLNALAVWEGLGPELRARTRAILASSTDKTTLVTTDDIQILVGSAEDIGRKDLIAREILEEHAGSVVYVNVRTVERPTWRAVED